MDNSQPKLIFYDKPNEVRKKDKYKDIEFEDENKEGKI